MIHFEVSLTAMKVTCVVCIKIIVIMNEKNESPEV